MRGLRKWLILVHRYLGIALGVLFVVWFVSGIAMIYARGMPELSGPSRLARMPPLDLSRVLITASDAGARAGLEAAPGRVTLLTILERPAYRIEGGDAPITVFADTGERLSPLDARAVLGIARRFLNLPEQDLQHAGVLTTADQWTITERRRLPLHKILVGDAAKTELYVSPQLGEVVLQTTRRSRMLAWVSAIPHWLYFTSLRLNDSLWRQVVIGLSALGTVAALVGLALGILQFSVSYRGWLRWHYVTGVTFGVFTLTWVFSGLLSMEPWFWASSSGADFVPRSLAGGSIDLEAFPRIDPAQWSRVGPPREIQFLWIQGEPHYSVLGVTPEPLLLTAQPLAFRREPFSQASILSRIRNGNPDVGIAETTLLPGYDAYYYANEAPSGPVLRVKLADPEQTWLYVDPASSRLVASFSRKERWQRWIYRGLHSLDFSFWYGRRPLWDIGMIVLSVGGTLLSIIGVVIGYKRVARSLVTSRR